MERIIFLLIGFLALSVQASDCEGYGVYKFFSELHDKNVKFYNCDIGFVTTVQNRKEGTFHRFRIYAKEIENAPMSNDQPSFISFAWPASCEKEADPESRNYYSISVEYNVEGRIRDRFIQLDVSSFSQSLLRFRMGELIFPDYEYRHVMVCGLPSNKGVE